MITSRVSNWDCCQQLTACCTLRTLSSVCLWLRCMQACLSLFEPPWFYRLNVLLRLYLLDWAFEWIFCVVALVFWTEILMESLLCAFELSIYIFLVRHWSALIGVHHSLLFNDGFFDASSSWLCRFMLVCMQVLVDCIVYAIISFPFFLFFRAFYVVLSSNVHPSLHWLRLL